MIKYDKSINDITPYDCVNKKSKKLTHLLKNHIFRNPSDTLVCNILNKRLLVIYNS